MLYVKLHWTIRFQSLLISKPSSICWIAIIFAPLIMHFSGDACRWSYKLKLIEKFQKCSHSKIENFHFVTWPYLRKKPSSHRKGKKEKCKTYVFSKITKEQTHVLRNAKSSCIWKIRFFPRKCLKILSFVFAFFPDILSILIFIHRELVTANPYIINSEAA